MSYVSEVRSLRCLFTVSLLLAACFLLLHCDFFNPAMPSMFDQRSTWKFSSDDKPVDAATDNATYVSMCRGQLPPDDPRVLSYIRRHIDRPSGLPLNLADKSGKKDFSILGSSQYIDRLLAGRTRGFFVECGGADGEAVSNSLFFELSRNWTGLLVELNPVFYSKILSKHRNVYSVHACLATTTFPMSMKVRPAGLSGGIAAQMNNIQLNVDFIRDSHELEVLCLPLNAIMDAMQINHIDFFSLDVEGAEVAVLEAIDFQRLRIDVIMVEYTMIGLNLTTNTDLTAKLQKMTEIRRTMAATRLYREVDIIPVGASPKEGHDLVFVRL